MMEECLLSAMALNLKRMAKAFSRDSIFTIRVRKSLLRPRIFLFVNRSREFRKKEKDSEKRSQSTAEESVNDASK